jgi:twitching motility protein PilT
VDRIIDIFPANQQPQIRATLADTLKAVVAQTLFKRADVKGRCAALEILMVTPAVANLIREGKTYQLPGVIQTGKKYGMMTLDDSIMDLLRKRWISPIEAYDTAVDKQKFLPFLPKPPEELGLA